MVLLALALLVAPQAPPVSEPPALETLLRRDARLTAVLDDATAHRLQILVAEPDVRADGTIGLHRRHLGDPEQYFYPASSIKLCGAIAALLQLNNHNRAHGTALGLGSTLVIEPRFAGDVAVAGDPSNVVDGKLTLEHDLRKLFLVSDNAAYNHCFELVGPDGLNRMMWAAGFTSVRLWHRLSELRTLAENRPTRGVVCDGVTFAARDAPIELRNDRWHSLDVGTAYLAGERRVDAPRSFREKNAIRLQDLQDLLAAIVRPEIHTGKRGFPELSVGQRAFLVQALGEYPSESTNPRFDPAKVEDHACKFVLRGASRVIPAAHLRIYDKIGRAYGFSIENAWIEDRRTGRGFFLAIVLHTNQDGVLNDDQYEYETIAEPFLDAVGEVLTRALLGAR